MAAQQQSRKTVRLKVPVESTDLAGLEIGSVVYLDGVIYTAREGVYKKVLEEVKGKSIIVVVNKTDLPRKLNTINTKGKTVEVSCRTGNGMDELRTAITEMVKQGTIRAPEHAWAVNERHKTALKQAGASLEKSLESAQNGLSPEFIAVDLRGALDSLGLIVGATYTEDILDRIFNDFCIGK